MNFIELFILGLIQGITEFLPISSSGHLLIARKILSFQTDQSNSFFEVFLHGGTLLSIIVLLDLEHLHIFFLGQMFFYFLYIAI